MGRVNSYQGCGRHSLTRSGHPGQFFAHFHHTCGCAGSVDTTVHFHPNTAGVGLFVGFDKEDLVKDGSAEVERKVEELVGDRIGNELGMRGFSFEDESQANDGGGFFVLEDEFGGERNLESAGNPDKVDSGAGHESGKFVDGGFDHGISIFLIKLRSDDGEFVPSGSRNARFWRDREAHEDIIYGKWSSACQTTSGFNPPSGCFGQLLAEKRIGEEKAKGDRGREANQEGEEQAPFGFYPSEEENEGEEAEEPSMDATGPSDGFMIAGLGAINHGPDENEPRKAFDEGDEA